MGVSNMFHRNVLLGGAVLWLTACGGQVVLKTNQERYSPGADLSLRIQNESDRPFDYDLCTPALQRREEGTWTKVEVSYPGLCGSGFIGNLPPGRDFGVHHYLGQSLPEGTYRYVTSVEWSEEEREEVVSNTFSVAHAE